MNTQIYILWKKNKAFDLFQYIQEECAMVILPVKRITNANENDNYAQCSTVFFVRKNDAELFRYKKFRDESGEIAEVIYPFDRNQDNLPYIEYTYECFDGDHICRIWSPTCCGSSIATKRMKQMLRTIKKWVIEHSQRREKINGLWVYII